MDAESLIFFICKIKFVNDFSFIFSNFSPVLDQNTTIIIQAPVVMKFHLIEISYHRNFRTLLRSPACLDQI